MGKEDDSHNEKKPDRPNDENTNKSNPNSSETPILPANVIEAKKTAEFKKKVILSSKDKKILDDSTQDTSENILENISQKEKRDLEAEIETKKNKEFKEKVAKIRNAYLTADTKLIEEMKKIELFEKQEEERFKVKKEIIVKSKTDLEKADLESQIKNIFEKPSTKIIDQLQNSPEMKSKVITLIEQKAAESTKLSTQSLLKPTKENPQIARFSHQDPKKASDKNAEENKDKKLENEKDSKITSVVKDTKTKDTKTKDTKTKDTKTIPVEKDSSRISVAKSKYSEMQETIMKKLSEITASVYESDIKNTIKKKVCQLFKAPKLPQMSKELPKIGFPKFPEIPKISSKLPTLSKSLPSLKKTAEKPTDSSNKKSLETQKDVSSQKTKPDISIPKSVNLCSPKTKSDVCSSTKTDVCSQETEPDVCSSTKTDACSQKTKPDICAPKKCDVSSQETKTNTCAPKKDESETCPSKKSYPCSSTTPKSSDKLKPDKMVSKPGIIDSLKNIPTSSFLDSLKNLPKPAIKIPKLGIMDSLKKQSKPKVSDSLKNIDKKIPKIGILDSIMKEGLNVTKNFDPKKLINHGHSNFKKWIERACEPTMADKPPTISRPMKFPYTFSAKIAQFPLNYYIKNQWIWRYYFIAMGVCIPVFYSIHKLANSPANVAKWAEIRRKEAAEHHH